jgi:hypothetical protein
MIAQELQVYSFKNLKGIDPTCLEMVKLNSDICNYLAFHGEKLEQGMLFLV